MSIPPLGITGVAADGMIVVITKAFVEHEEIVAVQVHWVGGMSGVDVTAEDQSDGVVGTEIVDVPLRVVGIGCISGIG